MDLEGLAFESYPFLHQNAAQKSGFKVWEPMASWTLDLAGG